MIDKPQPRVASFIPMFLVVFIGATFIGLVASAFAGLGYGLTYKYHEQGDVDPVLGNLATVLGTSGSALAGVIWSIIMIRHARSRFEPLMRAGVCWGMALGLGATLIMHGGLILTVAVNAPGRLNGGAAVYLGIGIACALVSGPLLGLLGSTLCQRAAQPGIGDAPER